MPPSRKPHAFGSTVVVVVVVVVVVPGSALTTSDTNMSTLFSTSATSDCVTHPPLLLAFSSAFANAALNCASALSRQAWLTGIPAAAAFA